MKNNNTNNTSNTKYCFTGEEKRVELPDGRNVVVKRIAALRTIKDNNNVVVARQKEKGGWIGSENNLSEFGGAWVSDNAIVCDEAIVYQDGQVSDNAIVFHYGAVSGKAKVSGEAMIYEKGILTGEAKMLDKSKLHGHAKIYGSAILKQNANVASFYDICGDQTISSNLLPESEDEAELGN